MARMLILVLFGLVSQGFVNGIEAQSREVTLRILENLWTLDSAKFDEKFCFKEGSKEANLIFTKCTDLHLKKPLRLTFDREPYLRTEEYFTLNFKDKNGHQCRCGAVTRELAENKTLVEAQPNDRFQITGIVVMQEFTDEGIVLARQNSYGNTVPELQADVAQVARNSYGAGLVERAHVSFARSLLPSRHTWLGRDGGDNVKGGYNPFTFSQSFGQPYHPNRTLDPDDNGNTAKFYSLYISKIEKIESD